MYVNHIIHRYDIYILCIITAESCVRRRLPKIDLVGKPDPVVVFRFNNKDRKTATVHDIKQAVQSYCLFKGMIGITPGVSVIGHDKPLLSVYQSNQWTVANVPSIHLGGHAHL